MEDPETSSGWRLFLSSWTTTAVIPKGFYSGSPPCNHFKWRGSWVRAPQDDNFFCPPEQQPTSSWTWFRILSCFVIKSGEIPNQVWNDIFSYFFPSPLAGCLCWTIAFSFIPSPLAGEGGRRPGEGATSRKWATSCEGDKKGLSYYSPSSVCSDVIRQTTSPARGEVNERMTTFFILFFLALHLT